MALGYQGFANRAAVYGITSLGSVHDSLGCLPSDAERFRRIIRYQFVRMYEENDVVLAQVLERAREDLGENAKTLPETPERGKLDIGQVREAQFAFA